MKSSETVIKKSNLKRKKGETMDMVILFRNFFLLLFKLTALQFHKKLP